MRLVRVAHGVGKGVVPRALVVDRVALRIASRQRLDQRAFRRGGPTGQRERRAGRVMSAGQCRGLAGGVVQFPRVVVVRSGRVTDAPMRHGAVWVRRQRLLEAGDGFLVVIAEAPVEATVEPTLGLRRGGRHLAGIAAEIIGIVHVPSSSMSREVGRRRTVLGYVERSRGRLHAELIFSPSRRYAGSLTEA